MTGNDWLQRLEEGLRNAAEQVQKVRGSKKKWLVFGTGSTTELYLPCFAAEGIDPIAYVDNNTSKYETGYYGKPVVPASKIAGYADAAVLLCTDDRGAALQYRNSVPPRGRVCLRTSCAGNHGECSCSG